MRQTELHDIPQDVELRAPLRVLQVRSAFEWRSQPVEVVLLSPEQRLVGKRGAVAQGSDIPPLADLRAYPRGDNISPEAFP